MADLVARAMLHTTMAQIHHVTPVWPRAASAPVARVYQEVDRYLGVLAPPVALHAPVPAALLASWLMLRDTLLRTGQVDRAVKEAVAAAVSLGNECPYCVDVHTTVLAVLAGGGDARALGRDHVDSIADERLRAASQWARASGERDQAGRHPVPASAAQLPELVGTAVTFQYLNRMVNVFLDRSFLPPRVPTALHGGLRRVLGRLMRPDRAPGSAPCYVDTGGTGPVPALPADLSWAAASAPVAAAFARAADTVAGFAERCVPGPVQELVRERLSGWSGRPAGPGRSQFDAAVASLAPAHRPAGRLALLTALASYQVGPSVVAEFQHDTPGDGPLLELTAWASFTAARQIGTWVPAASQP